MKNIKLFLSVIFACFLFASEANAWLIIPGALIDAVIGVKGEHCVEESAKIGDVKYLQNGSSAEITGFSWLNKGCFEPTPRRAELKFNFFKSKSIINLPDGYKISDVNTHLKINGSILKARKDATTIDIYTNKISTVPNLESFKIDAALKQKNIFSEIYNSESKIVEINGIRTTINQIKGSRASHLFNKAGGSLLAVIPTEYEVLTVIINAKLDVFEKENDELMQIFEKITFSKETAGYEEKHKSLSDYIRESPTPKAKTGAELFDEILSKDFKESISPADASPEIIETPPTSSSSNKTTSEKLHELNQIYKDGLITKEDFEAKKKELLQHL